MTDELHRSMRRSIYYPDGSGPRLELIYRSGSPASEPEVAEISKGVAWIRWAFG